MWIFQSDWYLIIHMHQSKYSICTHVLFFGHHLPSLKDTSPVQSHCHSWQQLRQQASHSSLWKWPLTAPAGMGNLTDLSHKRKGMMTCRSHTLVLLLWLWLMGAGGGNCGLISLTHNRGKNWLATDTVLFWACVLLVAGRQGAVRQWRLQKTWRVGPVLLGRVGLPEPNHFIFMPKEKHAITIPSFVMWMYWKLYYKMRAILNIKISIFFKYTFY